jgi:WD40 repeat protein
MFIRARREAERRVGQVAARAAAGRSHAQELEAELAGSVVDLQSTREAARVLGNGDHRDGSVVCPYKGLAPFEADDAEYFFGRERLVAELVARLVGASLLAVAGPSGSGKSSVIRAGLLPALAAGVLPGSDRWTHALIRPGRHPLRELSHATSRHGGRQVLLVVDQFEEVFTACADERERSAFIEALVGAARAEKGVVLAVRADFYGRCAAYPSLSGMLGANHVLVGPMARDELSCAIELPARRAGLRLEPGLADRLLADCEGEPGALPLLSTALLELWQQRDGRDLRLAGYERTGGVRGAVARLAESAYARLDREQRMVARRILLRLAGEDVQGALVRRRVAVEELDSDRDDVGRVLDVLTESRMITTSDGAVEVAHEALLCEWPRLRGWLDEDREGRVLHRRLSEAAREWTAGGRDRSELYRGGRLASALEWRAEHDPELNAAERQFLDTSRAAGERARRRTRLAFAGVLGLLVIATAAALIALDQRGEARAEARVAEAQRLSVQALSEEQLDRSLLLARQAVALDDSPTTRDNLLAALRGSPAAVAVLPGDGDGLNAIDVAPDGRTVAIGDSSGTVMFWDAVTRRRVGARHQSGAGFEISAVAFSPDGTRLATAGSSAPWGGFVDLFDGRTRRHISRLTADRTISENVVRLTFSRDSRVLAAQTGDTGDSAPLTRLVRWDARTGRLLAGMRPIPGRSSTLLGFTARGRRVVTSSLRDRETVVRDAATLRPLRRFPVAGSVAAMNATEDVIAFGSPDGSLRLLDLRTGEVRKCRGRHEAPVSAIRFSADRRHLVSAGRDERLIVWDATCAAAIETLRASDRGVIVDVAVARDGQTAYTASRDGTAVAWDLTGERRWERAFEAGSAPPVPGTLTTAARADALALIDARGFVNIFDTHTLRHTAHVRPRRGRAVGAALAPAGATLAITTDHGELELWDTRTRRRMGEPQIAHAFPSLAVTFSADGRWLATGDDPILRLWDARRGSAINNLVLGAVADLSFSPSGTTLAATHLNTNFSGGLEIRSVPDLRLIRTVPMPLGTVGRFSQDGRSLIYAARDGRVWMLDTTTWRPRGRPIKAPTSILTADLSADGRLLATTSTDGTGTLWDVASRRPIGATLSGASSDPIDAAFLRGGTHLAVVHQDESVIWDVRPRSWTRHACAVAGRTLTRSEWENALPRHNYAPTCHDLG